MSLSFVTLLPAVFAQRYSNTVAPDYKVVADWLKLPEGRTEIFLATPTTNALVFSFDWYTREIFLQHTAWGVSVVRFGPWARGGAASSNELALALYLDGKLLKSYSTLDIAGSPTNVSRSVSHYTVFSKINGYRWIRSNDYAFDVLGRDGKRISFDVRTGEIIK